MKSQDSKQMPVEIINQTSHKLPTAFIKKWMHSIYKELFQRKVLKEVKGITVVFVSTAKIKKLNLTYRNKNKPTDILSFDSLEESSLGELVLCLPILKKQALEHNLTLQLEIGYMLLHGVLHLLGYDHEQSASKAKKMFDLQDHIFEKLK